MTDIEINDLTPRNQYTAAGGETEFDYTFPTFDKDHLLVQESDPDDLTNPVTLVRGTDYTVTGVGAAEGGTIVLDTGVYPDGAPEDFIYTITRIMPYERLNDYQFSGDFESSDVNADFDTAVMLIQQLNLLLRSTARLDPTDSLTTLPIKIETAARRGARVLGFNAAGTGLETGPLFTDVDILGTYIDNINTVADNISSVNTCATNIANVNTVAGSISNVNAVGANIAAVVAVDANETNINTVAADLAGDDDIGTVADSIADVNTVAAANANIAIVAADLDGSDTIGTVAGIAANVSTVAGIAAAVSTVAGNTTNINTVSGNTTNINTVAGISANVTTVAGISAAVSTVAGISAAVSTVSGISANVTTVAGISAAVSTVAGISSAVSAVAVIDSDVSAVSAIAANVTTVAGNTTNINTVAGISANVTTVAGISSAVSTVAANIADVNTAAANIAAIIAAPDAATEAYHWANYPEDSLVPEGNMSTEYSAYHWAQKASAVVGGYHTALSLQGNPTNATAASQDIAAASDHQVMRRSGTALAFGAVNLASSNAVTGSLPVANGGTGLSAGTSGGIPYFSSTSAIASSALLTDNVLMVGGGAGTAPNTLTAGLGTTTQVLHGNAAGEPTWGAVSLTADVTGLLPFANLASGSALSVLGRASNSSGVHASIAAGSDGNVLRRSGTSLAFGAIDLASSNAVSGILPGANGGTNNGFFAVSGPASSLKTFTLPNASAAILTDNAAVTVAQGGSGRASATAYGVICGGTTSTGAHQSVASVGTAGQVLTSNGAGALPTFQDSSAAGRLIDIQIITASGNWTKPAGIAFAEVEIIGSGSTGGGGTTSRNYGGPAGNTSSFGSHISCPGGAAGPNNNTDGSGAAGGGAPTIAGTVIGGGDLIINGSNGCAGMVNNIGADGGDSPLGFGGKGSTGNGTDAVGYGAGGGSGNFSGNFYAGGGGAGTYVKGRILAADLGATESVTIGAQAAAATTTPANGDRGGRGGPAICIVRSYS